MRGVIPQVMTVLMHFMGGFAVAAVTDKLGGSEGAGTVMAAGVGFAKEVSDFNFNGPDFIAWPLGAWAYHATKDMPGCFETEPPEHAWYITGYRPCIDKGAPALQSQVMSTE